jgi:hypothetical protein
LDGVVGQIGVLAIDMRNVDDAFRVSNLELGIGVKGDAV